METIDHGTATLRDEHGRFTSLFTLTYETDREDGERVTVVRRLPARGVESVGRVINRMGDRGEVWNIRVTDSTGVDVTLDFDCFQT